MTDMEVMNSFGRKELKLLVSMLVLENIQKPGAVLNMMVDEFEKAEVTVVNGKKYTLC